MLISALTTSSAWALALGRISVQSYLGQPLQAEIDLPSITAAEASSLRAAIASPEAFRAASMEYNGLLTDVRLQLEQRADGRSVLKLRSTRPVNEPFMDVVLDVNWANGHMVRGYTMLLDPVGTPQAKPVQTLPAAAPVAAPVVTAPPSSKPPKAKPAKETTPAVAESPAAAPPAEASETQDRVKIAKGDTAYGIAKSYKPDGVTLEQMLVGMLRANPKAFMGSNVNRMKAGVVLDLPTQSAAQEVSQTEARRMIVAQSQDFNAYRRRLAGATAQQDAVNEKSPSDRAATGTVQTEVSEPAPASPAPDKLTLSKGAVKAAENDESKIASERQKAEAEARQQELNRNLEELKKLSTATADETAPATATAEAETPPETAAEPTAETAPTSPPAPVAPKAPTPPAPTATAATTDWLQDLLSNPMLLPAAGGAAAIAGLLALLRLRRKRANSTDSEFTELELPLAGTDSAQAHTASSAQSTTGVSSMMYSPSQLDAGGDVDPIAEADVYLAYGRDKQAEEILLEALRLHPDRTNIHMKLLEIYAQRRDVMAFAGTATEVFKLTEGSGPDWEQARTLGQGLDPNNPLYAPSGDASPATPIIPPPVELDLGQEEEPSHQPSEVTEDAGEASDFDLELPLDSGLETASPEESGIPSSMDFDLDIEEPAPAPDTPTLDEEPVTLDVTATEAVDAPAAEPATDLGLDFDFTLDMPSAEPETAPEPAPQAAPSMPPEFEGLSLDLDDLGSEQVADADLLPDLPEEEGGNGSDPLETKLSLAQEFEAIGDTEGARSLAEEVVAEASGSLQARAQAFLAQLP